MTTNTIVTEVSELIKTVFGKDVEALGNTDTTHKLDGISVTGIESPHIKLTFLGEENNEVHFVEFDVIDESITFDLAVTFFFTVYEDILKGEKYDSPIDVANTLIQEDSVDIDYVELDDKQVWLAS